MIIMIIMLLRTVRILVMMIVITIMLMIQDSSKGGAVETGCSDLYDVMY